MKRTVSLFIYIVAAICAMAQTKKGPEFPGGEEMLRQFLKDNALGKVTCRVADSKTPYY